MASDWIKMRVCLIRDGRIRVMSRSLATHVTHVCGGLFVMWSLADEVAVETDDGGALLEGYEPADLDADVGIDSFTKSLPECWMEIRPDGLYLPEYTEHNGSTGKKRATDQKRQSRKRRQSIANEATKKLLDKIRLEEIRKEENKNTHPPNSISENKIQEDADDALIRAVESLNAPVSSSDLYTLGPAMKSAYMALPPEKQKSKAKFAEQWILAVRRGVSSLKLASSLSEYYLSPVGRGTFAISAARFLEEDCHEDNRAAWSKTDASEAVSLGGAKTLMELCHEADRLED